MYILPFIVVLVSLCLVKESSHKPFCIIAGIFFTIICSVCTKRATTIQCIRILIENSKSVLVNNCSLFITLLLFGCLIRIITESGVIEELSIILRNFISNKIRFLFFLIGCALIVSVDDYLACIFLTTVLGTCYQQLNLSKTDVCFFINSVVVAYCSMLPVSTWSPIITEALSSNVTRIPNELLHLRFYFNYYIYFSFMTILVILVMKKTKMKSPRRIKKNSVFDRIHSHQLIISFVILYVVYMGARYCRNPFISSNALLISCASTLVFCHLTLIKGMRKKYNNIFSLYIKGVKDMWNLVVFLYVLWIYTNCLEDMLRLNELILYQVMKLNMPFYLLPVVIFFVSGVVSYCTGSVFATIRLLVPMALSLGLGLGMHSVNLCLVITSSINGSLLASISPLSDTMAICCDKMKQDESDMYKAHLPYSFMTILVAGVAYLIAGIFMEKDMFLTIVVPIVIACPLLWLCIASVLHSRYMLIFRKTRISWLLSVYGTTVLRGVFWRCAKPQFKDICNFTNNKYTSSKPIRTRAVYKLKLC